MGNEWEVRSPGLGRGGGLGEALGGLGDLGAGGFSIQCKAPWGDLGAERVMRLRY